MAATRPPATSTRKARLPESRAPWLLITKVTPPERAEGYFHRPALFEQLEPAANRRVSVLRAPGGFGKTTTLTEVARRAKEQGVLVAWLTVDEDDAPGLFGAHLAYAFEHAGLDLEVRHSEEAWTATPLTYQIGTLIRAIEMHAAPCLLVLDQLERLPSQSVELLERLLRRGPDVLGFALSFRANPGLDLASIVVAGSAGAVTTEQFRFSKSEIDRFFEGNLTRKELSDVFDDTAGWPVAVRIDRTMRMSGSVESIERRRALTRNFIDASLLRGLSDRHRALLLDLAVLDWIDTDLADEVLGTADTRLQVEALLPLVGLLTPADRKGAVLRLHPLVKEHCVRLLAAQDPARKQHLHRRIAEALAHREQWVPAWRHATETGDRRFLGEMMERVGVFRLWLHDGPTCLAAVDRFLSPAVLEMFPRLALIRCVGRCLQMEFEEARELYETIKPRVDPLARGGAVGDFQGLLVDRLFTEATLAGSHSGAASVEVHAVVAAELPVPAGVERTPLVLCGLHLSGFVSSYQTAAFETFRRHGSELRSHLVGGGFRHAEVFVEMYLGMAAMAQGHVNEATGRYAVARRLTKTYFAANAVLATAIDALTIELDIERDRQRPIEQRTVNGLLEPSGVWTDIHEPAIAVAAELTLTRHGAEAAIQLLANELARVRAKGTWNVSRYVSALLSQYSIEAGRSDQGEQVWHDERLPVSVPDLIDLDRQSWREMEGLSCARIRLLTELGDRDAARDLANRLRGIASERGLTRTLMRALVLSMTIGADTDRAVELLVEFLRLTRSTDYLRPLVRHRDVSRGLLTRLLDKDPEPEVHEAARAALAHLDGPLPPSVPVFSAREQAVLAELGEGLRNREIADRLGMSEHGVRHHLKNIYRKTGTTDRRDAVRRATSMGLRL